MQIKLFEIRDRATFIPAIAIKLGSDIEKERWLLSRVGYGIDKSEQESFILFGRLGDLKLEYHFESDTRTMPIAHKYIKENWDFLVSGQVIDVEYTLGESEYPKESEYIEF